MRFKKVVFKDYSFFIKKTRTITNPKISNGSHYVKRFRLNQFIGCFEKDYEFPFVST